MKKWLAIFIAAVFLLPAAGVINYGKASNDLIWESTKSVYIKAGDDFYIHFNESMGLQFKQEKWNLSSLELKAVARSPEWIQLRLARQFEEIDGDKYARLILNAPYNLVDEIAFSVATCPTNAMPSPSLLYDNAYYVYKNAKYLDYANLIEFPNGSTTIEYTTMDNGKEEKVICPMPIYYWFVVHPRITFEDAEYVYGKFWREYLFYHNDIGYPLLMEKLRGIKYVWDNKTYYPPAHRTWKWSMTNHPTAIEAINYWVGKTVNQLAKGDRPGQPNIIAHEHNGFCGELQQISVAAQRAALIPSVGVCDLGEDHVWREFWMKGWHECDNWWADGGGCVANYSEYRYRWNKIISALFAWRGDSSIYDVTPKYIRQDDYGMVNVTVVDAFGRPVDGARVIVFGSWKANNFKDKLWGKSVGKIWSRLPDELKEKWEEKYQKAWEFYHSRVPGLLPWVWPSIWNYTDVDGKCSFHLGLGHSYLFLIDKDDLFYYGPFSIGKSNAMHYYITLFPHRTRHMNVRFILPDLHSRLRGYSIKEGSGKYETSISFKVKAYQKQRNPWDWKEGMEDVRGKIKFFVVNESNFRKYRNGEPFECYTYMDSEHANFEFNATDYYIVFKNDAKRTDILLNFKLKIRGNGDFIHVYEPRFGIVNVGMQELKGHSTREGSITIDGKKWNVYGNFSIKWNATPGIHEIVAKCGKFEKRYIINATDISPPIINIEESIDGSTLKFLHLKGEITDNEGISRIFATINGHEINLENKFDRNIYLEPGDYHLFISVCDHAGNYANKSIYFAVSGNKQKPEIKEVYYVPSNPNATSNIIIYAFVNKTFYNISRVEIIINGVEKEMFRYASCPVQPRHNEDALKNESNKPRYGIELAQLEKGEYKFRIKAIDTGGNIAISEEYRITVN